MCRVSVGFLHLCQHFYFTCFLWLRDEFVRGLFLKAGIKRVIIEPEDGLGEISIVPKEARNLLFS